MAHSEPVQQILPPCRGSPPRGCRISPSYPWLSHNTYDDRMDIFLQWMVIIDSVKVQALVSTVGMHGCTISKDVWAWNRGCTTFQRNKFHHCGITNGVRNKAAVGFNQVLFEATQPSAFIQFFLAHKSTYIKLSC